MAPAISPVKVDEPPESSNIILPGMARERRESERAIRDWAEETRRQGRDLTLMTLDVSEMTSETWAYRFIIAADPVAERCTLLFYGARFAALMGLPQKPDISVPMVDQIPARYVPVFAKGCMNATAQDAPVRMQGAVCREDGQQELYRAVFIPFKVKPDGQLPLAFGAFNCRIVEAQALALADPT